MQKIKLSCQVDKTAKTRNNKYGFRHNLKMKENDQQRMSARPQISLTCKSTSSKSLGQHDGGHVFMT